MILSFRRGTDGQVICSEGYAHALRSCACPLPVNSELERETIKSLVKLAEWVSKKSSPPTLTLEKPLFDIEVSVEGETGYVLPDFILKVTSGNTDFTVVIETMGYLDDEYCERKEEQHNGMKTLGRLVKDPPHWPYDSSQSLERNLWGVLLGEAKVIN